MIKVEAWLQYSARGTMVTRLAYIRGFYPSCAGEEEGEGRKQRRRKKRDPGTLVHSPCNFISHLKLSPLYHHTARGATCISHLVLYSD